MPAAKKLNPKEKKLTSKEKVFIVEYLKDLNAVRAGIRAGWGMISCNKAKGYYVYFLVCSVNLDIFYIGKGKGTRASSHAKNAKNGVIDNSEKYKRLKECNFNPFELVFVDGLCESDAYAIEKLVILLIGIDRLTNISEGCNDKIDREIAKLDEWLVFEESHSSWQQRFLLVRGRAPTKVEGECAKKFWGWCRKLRAELLVERFSKVEVFRHGH